MRKTGATAVFAAVSPGAAGDRIGGIRTAGAIPYDRDAAMLE
jgi:hypothetical protein